MAVVVGPSRNEIDFIFDAIVFHGEALRPRARINSLIRDSDWLGIRPFRWSFRNSFSISISISTSTPIGFIRLRTSSHPVHPLSPSRRMMLSRSPQQHVGAMSATDDGVRS